MSHHLISVLLNKYKSSYLKVKIACTLFAFTHIIWVKAQSFVEVTGTNYIATTFNSVDFVDIDSDGDKDFIQTGKNPTGGRAAKIYTNDGAGNFSLLPGNQLTSVMNSDVAYGDLNGDGTIDLVISGTTTQAGTPSTRIYFNNGGTDIFSLSGSNQLTPIYNSAIGIADIDNDTDLDIMITGFTGTQRITHLYTNNGSGVFTLVAGTSFTTFTDGTIEFFDADNDNDYDVLLTGITSSTQSSELYINDGLGNFSIVPDPFVDVRNSSTKIADVDNDGDMDVLLSGENINLNSIYTKLYLNNGSGSFTDANAPFTPLELSSIAVDDIDNNGFKDIIVSGYNAAGDTLTELYLNDGLGSYTNTPTDLIDVGNCAIDTADIDNDGDTDIVLSGWADDVGDGTSGKVTTMFTNNLVTLGTQNQEKSKLSLYPNPISDVIHLNLTGNTNIQKIDVFDKNGRKIKSFDSNENILDISDLSSGIYILKVSDELRNTYIRKLIKN